MLGSLLRHIDHDAIQLSEHILRERTKIVRNRLIAYCTVSNISFLLLLTSRMVGVIFEDMRLVLIDYDFAAIIQNLNRLAYEFMHRPDPPFHSWYIVHSIILFR